MTRIREEEEDQNTSQKKTKEFLSVMCIVCSCWHLCRVLSLSDWFTDCHLKVIFNINTSRLQPRSTIIVDGKDVRLITGVSVWTRLSAILFRIVNHNCDLTIRLHTTTSLKSISQKRWLYHHIFKIVHLTSSTLSNIVTWPIVLRPHWSNRLQLIFRYDKS